MQDMITYQWKRIFIWTQFLHHMKNKSRLLICYISSFWLRKFVLSLTLNICGWWLFSCTLCYVDNYLFHVIIHLILCTHPHTKLNDPCSFNPFPSNSSGLRFRAEVRFCFCVTVTAYVLKQVLLYRQLQSVLMKLQLQDTIEIYIWLWLFLAKQRQ